MTDRSTAKVKRSDSVKAPRKPSGGGAEAEVMRLREDLAKAQQRIAELERRQSDLLNRIDWVIDSLHNLGE